MVPVIRQHMWLETVLADAGLSFAHKYSKVVLKPASRKTMCLTKEGVNLLILVLARFCTTKPTLIMTDAMRIEGIE